MCGLWVEVVIFFAQIVVLFKSFPNFAPDFAREAKAVGRGSLRRVVEVENLSRIIWWINFLCLLLQSKTVDIADVAQLARAADL